MAFDFPPNPVVDQTFTSGGVLYIFNGYGWAASGSISGSPPVGPAPFVLKTGDTMSGFLTLNADPTAPMYAATKQYVDQLNMPPPPGNNGEALVTNGGAIQWGGFIDSGSY